MWLSRKKVLVVPNGTDTTFVSVLPGTGVHVIGGVRLPVESSSVPMRFSLWEWFGDFNKLSCLRLQIKGWQRIARGGSTDEELVLDAALDISCAARIAESWFLLARISRILPAHDFSIKTKVAKNSSLHSHYCFHGPAPIDFSDAPVPATRGASPDRWPASLLTLDGRPVLAISRPVPP